MKNPLLFLFKYGVYFSVWTLVQISSRIFYSKIRIRNKKYLKIKSSAFVVSNHPNTLFDPLVVAGRIKRFVHILINASLYKSKPLAFLFKNSIGIKIERSQDKGGKKLDNKKAFQEAEEYLKNGVCIYSAVEGGSEIPRRLRKVKTGTARIALAAEASNDFQLGIEIHPVGLNYTSQTEFRSQIFMNASAPIRVADFQENYERDNFQGVLDLTAEIDRRLRETLIDTIDDDEDAFLKKLETVAQTEQNLSLEPRFFRSKKILNGWRKFQKENNTEANNFEKEVNDYFSFLEKNKTRECIVTKIGQSSSKVMWWLRTIFMVITFPIFLYGYLNNFLANYIPFLVSKKMNVHIAYTSAIKTLTGMLTYLIFYGIQIWLVNYFFEEKWIVWGYIVSIILTGLFTLWYQKFAKGTLAGWRLFSFSKKKKTEWNEILNQRKSIVTKVNTFLS